MDKVAAYSKVLLLGLALAVLPAAAGAGADKFSLDGYYKIRFTAYDFPDSKSRISLPVNFLIWAANNRARVNLQYNPFERVSFAFAYTFSPRVSDPMLPYLADYSPLIPQIDPQGYRVDDIKNRIYPDSWDDDQGIAFFQNLDRLNVTIHTELADFQVGRQAIAWGSARVINPTDVIAPFSYDELDTEYRVGVDAVRMRLPLGFMGELDVGYVAGSNFNFDRSAAYVRTKFYALKTDVTLLTVAFRENLMAGLDIARSLGGAGFWTEAAYVWADAIGDFRVGDQYDYFRITVGLDYSFGDKTYGFMEYHYNQAGAADAADYLKNITTPAYTEGDVYLMGRHYMIPGVNYQLTPLFTLSGELLVNLTEPSAYLTPQFDYNVKTNVYIDGGAFIGIGKYPIFKVDVDERTVIADLRSEFGSYTNTYFLSLKVYF
jgi:hypothetical protein